MFKRSPNQKHQNFTFGSVDGASSIVTHVGEIKCLWFLFFLGQNCILVLETKNKDNVLRVILHEHLISFVEFA